MIKGDIFSKRFRLVRAIPGGNQSEIWVCRDLNSEDDEKVALKILSGNDNEILQAFFKRETEALTLCEHPSIVKIFDSGYDDDTRKYWISLEYIEGDTLEEKLRNPSDDNITIQLLLEICDAVASAHSKDIIHRDLKPSNIMIDSTGSVKIVDFGISKIKTAIQDGATVRGFGSPPYTSPEQIDLQDADQKSDIYSLGVIFFRMLSGRTPNASEDLIKQLLGSDLQEEYIQIISKMVSFNKEDRYPSVLHFKRELMRLAKKYHKNTTILYVQPTQNFTNKLAQMELIEIGAESETKDWINKEFNLNAIYIEKGKQENEWIMYMQKYKIVAVQDLNSQFFLIKNIFLISVIDMARNVEYSFACNVTWKAVSKKSLVPKNNHLELLLDEILTWKKTMEIKKQKELQHKRTLSQWENVLKIQRKYLLEKEIIIQYATWDVSADQSSLEVDLHNEIEYSSLLLEQPILMSSIEENKRIKVGAVVGLDGKKMIVSLGRGVITDDIKEYGELTLDNKQVNAALKRQEDALRSVKYGDSKNPKLLEIIENPNKVRTTEHSIGFYYDKDLDLAKKRAISSTLGAELYLIQGPPGTGKTKVISEIVAQLVGQNPSVRILLTSQSNAAVDNALEATIKLTKNCSFLRIGRKDKIGDKLTNFQLEESIDNWIKKTTEKSSEFTQKLNFSKNNHLIELGEIADELSGLESRNSELMDLNGELEKLKYKLYESNNSDSINKEMTENIQKELELRESEYREIFSEILYDLRNIKILNPKVEWDRIFNSTDLLKTIQLFEREHERNRRALASLDQVEVIRQEWLKRLGRGREFEAICASETQVIASTCLGTANIPGVWSAEYDWVIVDEAGRATPPEILVPLVRGKKILLVGDHKQLPPIVDIDFTKDDLEKFEINKSFLETSLFEDIFNRSNDSIKSTLDIQYRMHSGIGQLISDVFYDGTVQNAESTTNLLHLIGEYKGKSVVWISTSTREERFESSLPSSKSKQNQLEAKIILEKCIKIEEELNGSGEKISIGIITGYTDQKLLIEQIVSPKDKEKWKNTSIEVDSVDAFQGQERDIVFYSIVRSNKKRDIGFLKDYRRLNVALSRARKLIFIVGDLDMVRDANTYEVANPFAEVIKHIQKTDYKNCSIEVFNK
ncbi:hypothetical protein QW71_24250 [Paenibacillus sp. IHB B 3415]|uniref:serine/threonine-protein kinase n=1 Tax=Paenibacillus sp. IHB B 3415 TaxID=867080 RepID=UPI00057314C9|nr:serine/threonine-protein kinase [Paenibacillus sp. IHB B 3415]KHL93252.1 hypothetical protein QW71_24250 [Paenibacillus sp. IHB B 3415]